MKDELNQKQQEAVEYNSGPLIIIAGPGTGKTKTLISKIEYLINFENYSPDEILTLTFTTKAVKEIKNRLDNNNLQVSTFHSLAYDLISRKEKVEIISQKQKRNILRDIRKSFSELASTNIKELELKISKEKVNNALNNELSFTNFTMSYQTQLKDSNYFDYDDLLINAYNIIDTNQKTPNKLKAILVDEFQDTNPLQFELIKKLTDTENITVIGDPYQSIYGFRGADNKGFESFKKAYTKYKEIILETNYRSKLTNKSVKRFSSFS